MNKNDRGTIVAGLALVSWLSPLEARAWILTEHVRIGRAASSSRSLLSQEQSATLQEAWRAVAVRHAPQRSGLCGLFSVSDMLDSCIDLPLLSALAGDHACSVGGLERTIDLPWVGKLTLELGELYGQILRAPTPRARVDLWNKSNIRAQDIDNLYIPRAEENSSHFVLPRRQGREHLMEYLARVSSAQAPINAVGTYLLHHGLALAEAARAACKRECKVPEAAVQALMYEAVALHFLEDTFSSGHVVGIPSHGGEATRAGTHDYYCQHGLTATTWSGEGYAAHGDAHLAAPDEEHVARVVSLSLSQVARALAGDTEGTEDCARLTPQETCHAGAMAATTPGCVRHIAPILSGLLVPPMEEIPMPPFPSELGAFLRFSTMGGLAGGLTSSNAPVARVGLDATVGVGVSLNGLTTSSSDATFFFQIGIAATSVQQKSLCWDCAGENERALGPRLGVTLKARAPFSILPGDGLLSMLMIKTSDDGKPISHLGWLGAINAAEGGILARWQRVFRMKGMRVQFIPGREVAFTIFGKSKDFVGNRRTSWAMTIPFIEWTLAHRYADSNSTSAFLQAAYYMERTPGLLTSHFLMLMANSDSRTFF